MNLNHLHKRGAVCRYILLCALLSFTSCIDNAYDLSNIDKEITIFGDVTMPLGSTDQILLSEIIDPDDIDILSIVDGTYGISINEDVDLSISKAGGEDGISIDIENPTPDPTISAISDNSLLNIEFEFIETTTIADNLSISTLGNNSDQLNTNMTLYPKYPSELQADITTAVEFNNISFALNQDNEPSKGKATISTTNLTIAESIEINSIDQINFGVNQEGFKLYLELNISSIYNIFDETTFVWNSPDIYVTLPEGYNINGGTNSTTISGSSNTTTKSQIYEMYVTSYTKPITANNDQTFDDLIADVECLLLDDITIVYGKTNGNSLESNISIDVTSEQIKISDVLLNVKNIDLPISATNINDEVEINGISTNITKINEINFATVNNNLELTISPIVIPGNLAVKSGSDDIDMLFPKDIYTLDSNDATESGENYVVTITNSEFISTTGFTKLIGINTLTLDAEVVDKDQDSSTTDDGVAKFYSSIDLLEATISVDGTIWNSEYNSYVEDSAQKSISINTTTPSGGLEVEDAIIESKKQSCEVNQTAAIVINETIPSNDVVIEQIYGMTFIDESGDPTNMNISIKIDIEGLPIGSEIGDLMFENYQIILPEFIEVAEDSDNDNIILLNGVIGNKNELIRSYETSLTVTNFDFENYSNILKDATDGSGDKLLTLDEILELKGNVYLTEGSLSTDDIELTVTTSIEISSVKIGRIEGKFSSADEDLLSINESIDMSSLSEDVEVDINNVVLTNPTITLNVDNTTAIPFEITSFTITSKKDGKEIESMSLNAGTTITIAAGDDEAGVSTKSEIILTSKESNSDNEYQIVGLENILNPIPDELIIVANTSIAGDRQNIDINKDYDIDFSYNVNIPLQFEEFSISYEREFDDIASSLEDVIDYITELELTLSIESTMPFDIDLTSLTPLDKSGNILDLPQILPDNSIINGTTSESAVSTDIVINLSDNDNNDITKLDAFIIKLDADITQTNNSMSLKESQYLQIGVKVRLPEGITIDLDEEL